MPIKTQNELPARAILDLEDIFIMDESRALAQDIRPLNILILNLMPIKKDTETQLLRALSNSPLQVDVSFLNVSEHTSKNTPESHLNKFYQSFDEIKHLNYDGMIITGAPVEKLEFEDVDYWEELTKIMEWTNTHVTSTIHVCWGAQAGLYYHYGIKKFELNEKVSGIYKHTVLDRKIPLTRSFDDEFYAPHSRYTGVDRREILENPNLIICAESKEAGVYLVISTDGKQIFLMGHPEYDRLTLNEEYHRDLGKNLNPAIPVNYYPDDNPELFPKLTWRSHANLLYSNWLNFYVYQITPYNL
ncbi:Homoserine O-succinyltransferase [Lachnospiraceae bacterium TWA4]|nr:Homoserine O-succinyltransferase [Lachnospiraceae bacterium TWA4]